jgi:hypothetical protein
MNTNNPQTPTELVRWIATQAPIYDWHPKESHDIALSSRNEMLDTARRIARSLSPSPDMPETISPLLLEACLCVWESILERRYVLERQHGSFLEPPNWKHVWESYGSAHFRIEVTPIIAAFALRVYDAPGMNTFIREELGWSYDWDFIPWIVDQITLFTDNGYPTLPDLDAAVQRLKNERPKD